MVSIHRRAFKNNRTQIVDFTGDNNAPNITNDEVLHAIKAMRNNKAVQLEQVIGEVKFSFINAKGT